jgi:glycosyltransferase involved in cell wall biosynthesis
MTWPSPLLVVSVASGYGGAERSIEIILRHLPADMKVGILAESPLHLAELRRAARPNMVIEAVPSEGRLKFPHAVRRFIALYTRLRPEAVLANTESSARILAAAAPWLPGLRARSHVYVRDFQWLDMPSILARLAGATVLVPHEAVLQRPGYLEPHVVPRGSLRASVVPDMAELPAETPAPSASDAPVLHLATINAWKGHRHLIAAAGLLRDAGRPLPVRSVGYVGDESIAVALRDQVARSHLRELVRLEPYVADPSPLLRDCLAVAITSVSHSGGPETFGRTLIEAWAHARPVVAFAAGAPARLIRHEQDGLLVPEGDEAALAAALRRLADDPALRERLGRAGFERCRAEFSAGAVTCRLLSVLGQSALSSASASPLPPPASRLLLDFTRTLEHGWLPAVGLTRVEGEVLDALNGRGLTPRLLRHDPAAGGYRPLNAAEAAWVRARDGIAVAGHGAPARPAAWRWWHSGPAVLGLAFGFVPRRLHPVLGSPMRAFRRLHRALGGLGAPPPAAPLPDGDVLVSVANPWDYAAPEFFRAWKRKGGRFVGVVHELLPGEGPQVTDGRDMRGSMGGMLDVLDTADHLVAVSAHSAASLAAATEACPGGASIEVVPPSISPSLCRPPAMAAQLPFPSDRPFVLFCSTIEVGKNHLLLLRLWDRLRRRLPPDRLPRLVFVGRWGWGVDAVRIWVTRDWRMAPHLTVLDGLPDEQLAQCYREALFTVFPSHDEGFGMPVAESLTCGTPVLVGTHPALREASENLMPALDPDDLPAWEREVLRIIEEPGRLDELQAMTRRYKGPEPGGLGRAIAVAAERLLTAPCRR